MITQTHNLNLIPGSVPPVVNVTQYDKTARTLVFNLWDGETSFSVPSGAAVTIRGTKPDGNGFEYTATASGSTVSMALQQQMATCAGSVRCEVRITSGTQILGTADFILEVKPSALNENTPLSETELPILQEAIEAAETVVSLSETFGSPLVASTAAQMTLTNRVYVYTGSESGYTYGNWYYYDGSAWVSGGTYNAIVNVDTALSDTSTNPVQNKAIATEINYVKSALNNYDELAEDVENVTDAVNYGGKLISATDVEQGSYNSVGATTSNTARIRTKGFIPVESGGLIKFTAGTNAEQIFYGKFDSNKTFIGDGTWGSGNIEVNWNGYLILVYRRASNGDITPSDYDANTLVMSVRERKSEGLQVFATAENPMNPLMFDRMYFRKGSVLSGTEYVTNYPEPGFINNHFDDLNGAPSTDGNSGYMSFEFAALNRPKVLASGETLTMYLIAKVNKAMSFTPRLSTSVTWSNWYSVAVAPRITLKAGYNCVKLEFTYGHTGTDSRNKYRFFSLEGNTVYTDLEAEIMLVSGEAFLGWVKGIEEITGQSFDTDLLFWGDSLTAGAGGGDTSYPKVCAETLGLTRINCGVGGETANTISARQGGNNVIIPAGNVNGTYTTLSDIFGASIAPLLQGTGSDSGNALIIDGQTCTLSHDANGYTISGYTGSAITVPKLARFRGSDFTGKVVVIFVGQNGATFTGLTGVDARIAIIDSMIKHIGHERYVIMGLSTGTNTSREADDNQMLAHYGNKFFPTRTLLVDYGLTINGLTPTAKDETDIANGTVPKQLRSDGTHMNAYGYTAIGKLLADKIRSLGYVD